MIRNILIAVALVAGVSFSVLSANACNPKTDPSCERGTDTITIPAPCNPKTDPTCDRGTDTVTIPAPCDPKTDPTCGN